jgi:hypothetical protein
MANNLLTVCQNAQKINGHRNPGGIILYIQVDQTPPGVLMSSLIVQGTSPSEKFLWTSRHAL